MADLEIRGQEEFVRVAKALNAQGSAGRGLKRELRKQIQAAADPMTDEVLNHVAFYLPNRYAAVLARDLKVRQSWSTRGNVAALRLTGTAKGRNKRRHVGAINAGTLRHRVYGRDVWVNQSVQPGFWDKPLADAREKPARAVRRAIQETARKIAKAG
jgi:hypothetical protein